MGLSDEDKAQIKSLTEQRAPLVWPLYDRILARAAIREPGSPWGNQVEGQAVYRPDFETLKDLLKVPLWALSTTQSQLPAKALDVWIAYELRRAGFDPASVWPRDASPRFVPRAVIDFIEGLNRRQDRDAVRALLGRSKATGADARIFGKNYRKQVDVGLSNWDTGPEILISSKRMDSSFGNNAANRVEEAYGDAKNLRLRHPLAAVGFVYSLRSTVLDEAGSKGAPSIHEFLVDLLIKLGREEDAYNAVALVMPEYESARPLEEDSVNTPVGLLDDAGLFSESSAADDLSGEKSGVSPAHLDALIRSIPKVSLNHEAVPEELSPARFFGIIIRTTLRNTPVSQHRVARSLLTAAEA